MFEALILGASRRGPDKGCRNSFAGLVMLPGLEGRRLFEIYARRPVSKRCPAQSDSRQPLSGPRRLACGGAQGGSPPARQRQKNPERQPPRPSGTPPWQEGSQSGYWRILKLCAYAAFIELGFSPFSVASCLRFPVMPWANLQNMTHTTETIYSSTKKAPPGPQGPLGAWA